MSPLKRLATQTLTYGFSSILGRFLTYLMVPLYTYTFGKAEYGVVSEFFAYAGFLGTLLVFGFETGFFRFIQDADYKEKVYSTALNFVLIANLIFIFLIVVFVTPISTTLKYPEHHEYFYWFAFILVFDSVASIPFARLRSENRVRQFVVIKFTEIGTVVLLNLFFILVCKRAFDANANSFFGKLYNPQIGVGYIFIANLIASAVKLALLSPQLREVLGGIDLALLKKLLAYSTPMVIIGFAGIINEMLDRVILKFFLTGTPHDNLEQLGIYGACYKLSILMTLFIQAFRYAAEPFFFSHAKEKNSTKVYADVMKYFVIICVSIFLVVTLYIDIFKYFIGKDFRVGLRVVPILLMANLFLGVYVNLSIWYKLKDKTLLGSFVSIGGALLTLVLNIVFIPKYSYMASAWATLACYSSMAVVSYLLGQKYYPVEYDLKSFFKYFFIALLFYFSFNLGNEHLLIVKQFPPLVISSIYMIAFLIFVWFEDGRKFLNRVNSSASI